MSKKMKYKLKNMKKMNIILFIILSIIIIICIFFIVNIFKIGTSSASAAYETARDLAQTEQIQKFYNLGYDIAEKENHVSNKVSLSIEGIKETSKLEVLEVSDVVFVSINEDENDADITAILEIPGTGIYTVNLQEAEFAVDRERSYILIRIPEPELSECSVNYADVNKLLFKDDIFNGSIATGEELAKDMVKDGYLLMQKEFMSDQQYFDRAKSSAENLIINMVQNLNPNIENLQVNVEFTK